MLTAKQVDDACRRGELVFGLVRGKQRRVMGVNFNLSTKQILKVTLWTSASGRWYSVEAKSITIRATKAA